MCGVAGLLHFDNSPACESVVRAMARTLAHRGPDASGAFVSGPAGLGHRRLSIIDLSEAGRQPMANENGSVHVTFNGEIYNFLELKKELQNCGHAFRSNSDTEVIVHAYEEWGVDCVHRFNGMFAFGLWDDNQQRLWLVRDRMGIKPLFYAVLPDRILFGSEIKAILAAPGAPRRLDNEALALYLQLNWTPAPRTLLKDVRQLEPGQFLTADAKGHVGVTTYWDLEFRENEKRSDQEWIEEFEARVEQAVRLRLVSDVPFGAFLSGGADSSTVSWFMAKNLSEKLKTFSIHFGEPTYDEDAYARAVAGTIGSEHHQNKVTAELATVLPDIVKHAEEPTADSSMVAVYYLARETRRHVTMVQSGDGADELLAGYETYQAHYIHRMFRTVPGFVRRGVMQPLVNRLPVSDTKVSWDFKLRQFLGGADLRGEDAHACWRMIFPKDLRDKLLAPLAGEPGAQADVIDLYRAHFARTQAKHPLNRLLYVDTRLYLPNDMLVKVDRMTMAHSLEARVPFLDHTLAEFMASIPPYLKLKNFRHKKYILKTMMDGKLPRTVLWRKKQGFNIPVARWARGDLKPFVLEHLSRRRITDMGILDPGVVQSLLEDHFENRADNSYRIWCLLTLSLWWRNIFETALS
jgi:asparagine synthase (glutamine-hydrolysing)